MQIKINDTTHPHQFISSTYVSNVGALYSTSMSFEDPNSLHSYVHAFMYLWINQVSEEA